MKRAVIACGGTGGHLSPGIALAEELISEGWRCELLISNKQVDSRLVRKYADFDYKNIPGSPFGLSPTRLIRFSVNLLSGITKCVKLYKRDRPDVVIGFGGFLSLPAMLAGYFSRIPVAIHEANRAPGRVTRIASSFANRIFLPQGISLRMLHSSRIRHVGMPVRREIHQLSRPQAKRKLGFDPMRKLIVIFGGSQGARALNDWVKKNLEILARDEVQVFCLTGMDGGSDSQMVFRSRSGAEVKSRFVRFSDEMATVLSAADLVVSRAGAGSISEITRCRVPAILIPYPYAADNHQLFNARYFEMQGGGITIGEDYIDGLLAEVKDTVFNDWLLRKFRDNLDSMNRAKPQRVMIREIDSMIREYEEEMMRSEQDGKAIVSG